MERKGNLLGVVATAIVALLVPQAAWASYTTISHNLVDGQSDTTFNSSTGVLTWYSNSPRLTLNDPNALLGTASNVTANLSTHLANYNPVTQEALFMGGTFMLTFDFAGSTGVQYSIGGPISGMIMKVGSTTANLSQINGEGRFWANSETLPGSNDWPDGSGLSSVKSLSLAFAQDLSNFAWDRSIGGSFSRLETSYTLYPNDSAAPEPTSMVLVMAGCALVAHRRRRA